MACTSTHYNSILQAPFFTPPPVSPVGWMSMQPVAAPEAAAAAGAGAAAWQRPQVSAHHPALSIQSTLHWPQDFFWAQVLPSAQGAARGRAGAGPQCAGVGFQREHMS